VTSFHGIEHDLPLSFLYCLSLYATAYIAAAMLLRLGFAPAQTPHGGSQNRLGAIDPLRGLLALGVVVHHTLASAAFFEIGVWGNGVNVFMNNLGRVGVGMFFMITGYLFTVKAAESSIDWKRFARHRFFRLFPLYFVVVVLVHLFAFSLTGWQLNTTALEALMNSVDWLAFAIRHRPDINGYAQTPWIIAGVNWTLKYEVFFYAIATPLLYAGFQLIGRRAMAFLVVATCTALYLANHLHVPNAHHVLNLYLGALCAFVLPLLKPNLLSLKLLATAALGALFVWESPEVVFLASVAMFLFMANLVQPAHVARGPWMAPFQWLGEISYSIYLIHGMVLFLGYLSFGVGMSMWAFWGFAMAMVAVVVLISSVTFRCVEKPLMVWGR
jgi:peptidoglycan/LPS O-acetylase OafA/YrhL